MSRKTEQGKGTQECALVFAPEFLEDLRYWVQTDRKTVLRILDLIEAISRDPRQGPGKPESLRHTLAGDWSRHITQEHRLVYRPGAERIDLLQCRYHY